MDRRKFVRNAGLGAIYATLPGNKMSGAEMESGLIGEMGVTASDVNRYLRSLGSE